MILRRNGGCNLAPGVPRAMRLCQDAHSTPPPTHHLQQLSNHICSQRPFLILKPACSLLVVKANTCFITPLLDSSFRKGELSPSLLLHERSTIYTLMPVPGYYKSKCTPHSAYLLLSVDVPGQRFSEVQVESLPRTYGFNHFLCIFSIQSYLTNWN